ncbi:PREDICTED: 39S ribosomal protein L27, mitochondrial [Dipodomys ordii]|uniref:Large ribosomal subunit protein bL27m n=1 Tax=Dipodomys ordii TaxID=10020 RepID=A0A1S3GTG9_DIPOR|nr:PREDICTED: 39S ribosomal protein L27, mitochondrial [Dipodomys ordii]
MIISLVLSVRPWSVRINNNASAAPGTEYGTPLSGRAAWKGTPTPPWASAGASKARLKQTADSHAPHFGGRRSATHDPEVDLPAADVHFQTGRECRSNMASAVLALRTRAAGHYVHAGNIIGTQRHFRWHPGAHVGLGKKKYLYALEEGIVRYTKEVYVPNPNDLEAVDMVTRLPKGAVLYKTFVHVVPAKPEGTFKLVDML